MDSSKVSSSEKAFIEFLIDYIVATNPGDMQTNLQNMSQHMLDNMPPKCEANLYRKQYGNLKDCILQGKGIKQVLVLDGTAFKFRRHPEVVQAYEAGTVTEAGFQRYMEGRTIYLNKHLNLMKTN